MAMFRFLALACVLALPLTAVASTPSDAPSELCGGDKEHKDPTADKGDAKPEESKPGDKPAPDKPEDKPAGDQTGKS